MSHPIIDKSITGISLARALKYKNELATTMKELLQRVQNNNSFNEKNPPAYNSAEQLDLLEAAIDKMATLKAAINVANAPVHHLIVKMRELKGLLAGMRGLDTIAGQQPVVARYGALQAEIVPEVRIAIIDELLKDQHLADWQAQINLLQEQLDEFNNKTNI